jgi:hypothetical protein
VIAAFRETGIVPWDPQRVIEKLPSNFETPPPSPHRRSITPNHTPVQARQLERYARNINHYLKTTEEPVSRQLQGMISKFVKGSRIRNSSGALAEELLEATITAEEARKKRQAGSRRIVQKGGVITVANARRKIQQEAVYDVKDLSRRIKKLTVRQKRRWQEVLKEFMGFVEEPYWAAHIPTSFGCRDSERVL